MSRRRNCYLKASSSCSSASASGEGSTGYEEERQDVFDYIEMFYNRSVASVQQPALAGELRKAVLREAGECLGIPGRLSDREKLFLLQCVSRWRSP
jgi:hypothetical protein